MDCDQSKLLKAIVKTKCWKQIKLAALLDKKLEPLHSLTSFINQKFEDIKEKISTLEERNAVLIKENFFLKQESSRMANAMNQMNAEFDNQEQYIRRDCLEIRWIPMSAKDDTNQIIKNVGSIVDVSIEDNDISISHRMKSENAFLP